MFSEPCTTWSYDASVAKMRPLVARWKSVTDEFLGELYRARQELSRKRMNVSNGTFTWDGYLNDIGLARQTVHRWLQQYDPETGMRVEPPEPKPEPASKPKPRPAAPPDPEPEDAEFWEADDDQEGTSFDWSHVDDSEPAVTTLEHAIEDTQLYASDVIEELATLSEKHAFSAEMIKYFRALAIRFDQEAGR